MIVTSSHRKVATTVILSLLRMVSAATFYPKEAKSNEPNSDISLEGYARQGCSGDSCCKSPYETVSIRLWTFAKSDRSCCVPNMAHDKVHCCPHPLIPSREPNMDPGFGPFCCDANTGHCCSKALLNVNKVVDYVYAVPRNGECCSVHDPSLGACCPRPLVRHRAPAKIFNALDWKNRKTDEMCCSKEETCFPSRIVEPFPTLRVCSPRGFCCPWPYVAVVETIQLGGTPPPFKKPLIYETRYDNKCYSPLDIVCELPLLPHYKSCIEQGFPYPVPEQDTPLYDTFLNDYGVSDVSKTITSSSLQCIKKETYRRAFGSPFEKVAAHSVPVQWITSSPYVQRSLPTNETIWPDPVMAFVFPISLILATAITIIPAVLLGALSWALVFNLRFLWHKKVRMAIRAVLVRIEKRRREMQDGYIPAEDRQKLLAHDRYQLPKALQDSDCSTDDEPAELKREETHWKETLWTTEEIDSLGFDPDNIPLEWIYGDLLNDPSSVRDEVRQYNQRRGRYESTPGGEHARLDSDQWLHFLRGGESIAAVTARRKSKLRSEKKVSVKKAKKSVKLSFAGARGSHIAFQQSAKTK